MVQQLNATRLGGDHAHAQPVRNTAGTTAASQLCDLGVAAPENTRIDLSTTLVCVRGSPHERSPAAGTEAVSADVTLTPRSTAGPGCTTEACDVRDNDAALVGQGYTVLGLSPDPVRVLEDFTGAHRLPYTLLSDAELAVHRRYGCWGRKSWTGGARWGPCARRSCSTRAARWCCPSTPSRQWARAGAARGAASAVRAARGSRLGLTAPGVPRQA